jgi:hypothetical protein
MHPDSLPGACPAVPDGIRRLGPRADGSAHSIAGAVAHSIAGAVAHSGVGANTWGRIPRRIPSPEHDLLDGTMVHECRSRPVAWAS